MSLTQRDIEAIKRRPLKEPRFTKFFVGIINLLSKIPPIRKYIRESIGGLSGRIFRHWENQEYIEATNVALFGLNKFRNKKMIDHHDWWTLMQHGVDSAANIENADLREKLIEYANSGIEPFEGYFVAYSYLEFSRWRYQTEDYENAVKYAKIASIADRTWAEPDFILGWYGLVLSTSDAEVHLSHAIEKDQRVLFRIANDDVCKQHPHIISKLKAKYSKVSNEN